MKIVTKFKAQVLAVNSTVSKDGNNTYYHLTVFLPDSQEAGQLSTSEDVAKNVITGKDYILNAEYNDKYNSFRVTGVIDE